MPVKNKYFIVFVCACFIISLFLNVGYLSRTASSKQSRIRSDENITYDNEEDYNECLWFQTNRDTGRSRDNIFFLKTHKCGSSTVQNILLRHGYFSQLDFVLPSKLNYIGNPKYFTADLINENLTTPDGKYNVFAHHTRYNRSSISPIMYDDTVYVTILRNPVTHFESLFRFYHFDRKYGMTFEDVVKNPEEAAIKVDRLGYRRFGLNQMCFDLGLDASSLNNQSAVEDFVSKISSEFHLVMIMEYMEASLVLLAHAMNWPLDKVTFLDVNSRLNSTHSVLSGDGDKEAILNRLNDCDSKLYRHFLGKLRRCIKTYGRARMTEDIKKLLRLNDELRNKCVYKESNKGYARTRSYVLYNTTDKNCVYSTKLELPFTEQIRKGQSERLLKIKQLNSFLNSK